MPNIIDPRERQDFTVPEGLETEGLDEIKAARFWYVAGLLADKIIPNTAVTHRDHLHGELRETYNGINDVLTSMVKKAKAKNRKDTFERVVQELQRLQPAYNKSVDEGYAALDNTGVTSRNTIFEELRLLSTLEDFEDVFVYLEGDEGLDLGIVGANLRPPLVCARTKPVTLQGKTAIEHFDPFILKLQINEAGGNPEGYFRVAGTGLNLKGSPPREVPEGYEPFAAREEGYLHPHIRPNGSVCMGDAQHPIRQAISRGDMGHAFLIMGTLVNSYNQGSSFYSIEEWTPVTRCYECEEAIIEADLAHCHQGGQPIHKTCGVTLGEHLYARSHTMECADCHTLKPRTNRADNTSDICDDCYDSFKQEAAAATQGQYICHNCKTHYEDPATAANNQLPMGYKDYVCPHCATTQGRLSDEGKLLWTVEGRGETPQLPDTDGNATQFTRQHAPVLPKMVTCGCGRVKPNDALYLDGFTGDQICPECDTAGMGLSPRFWQDAELIEVWVQNFCATYMFCTVVNVLPRNSLIEAGVTLEVGKQIIEALHTWSISTPYIPQEGELEAEDYAMYFNSILESAGIPFKLLSYTEPAEVV